MSKLLFKYKSIPVTLKASIWFLLCGFLQKGISIITTPIFTRMLSTAEYGQFSVFNSWQGILSVFITLNLSAGVFTQGLIKYDKDREKFTSSLYGLSLLLFICYFIIYLVGRNLWNSLLKLSTPIMICMLIITWNNTCFSFWSAKQRVDYKYKMLVGLTLITSVVQPVSGILSILLFPQAKVEARIISITVVGCLAYLWLFISQIRREKQLYNSFYWKYSLKFNIPLIPHYLSQIILSSCDKIMIEGYCGKADAGIYSLAYTLSNLMLIVNIAVNNTLNPWIYTKIKEKKYSEIAPVAYILLICIAAANLILIILAPEAVSIFAPESYKNAIWCIPPIAMSVYFIFMYDLFAKIAFYYEKTKFIMIASTICAAANIGLNAIFIPKLGYIAAAYTTLLCYILYDICHYIFMTIVIKEKINNTKIYNPLIILLISLIFVVFGFIILLLYKFIIIRLSILLIIAVSIFVYRKKLINIYETIIKHNNQE